MNYMKLRNQNETSRTYQAVLYPQAGDTYRIRYPDFDLRGKDTDSRNLNQIQSILKRELQEIVAQMIREGHVLLLANFVKAILSIHISILQLILCSKTSI